MLNISTIRLLRFSAAVGLFVAFGPLARAASVEAKADGVQVVDAPAAGGKVLMTLKAGEKMESKERKGMFWEVVTKDGKPGFVSFLKVQRQESGDAGLAKAIRDAAQDNRPAETGNSGRQRSAVMGVRGLDESSEVAAAGSVKPNLRLVYMMEDRKVDRAQLASLGNEVMQEVETLAKRKGMAP